MSSIVEETPRLKLKERLAKVGEQVQSGQVWSSIFRPGSIFRKGYTDSPRNRSYVVMNSVLYHLHPVKVKRHAVKVSYTLCLGGLSFFLFILLTITGIFLMFFYRPTAANAWDDIQSLHTSVTFGLMVRNMHRWGAHLMVLAVFLHMARVFYHGSYKAPREFNWVVGVILLTLTLLLSFTGYLLHRSLVHKFGSYSSAAPKLALKPCCVGMCCMCCYSHLSRLFSWQSTSGEFAKTAESQDLCEP